MTCSRGCCSTQREHYLSISLSATALPNKGRAVISTLNREKAWGRDHDAYRDARRSGLQPKKIDGVADTIARAQTVQQIEKSPIFTPEAVKRASNEGIAV